MSPHSSKSCTWCCPQGHEYVARPRDRMRGSSCPYCANRRILPGFNDLQTTHPALAKEFIQGPNGETAQQIFRGSPKKCLWRCPQGHEYSASPNNRSNRGSGCPICSGRRPVSGSSDLQSTHPLIAAEWVESVPPGQTPRDVLWQSNVRALWRCARDASHTWEAAVYNRTKEAGTGCPNCTHLTSRAEDDLYIFIRAFCPDAEQSRRNLLGDRSELDIYIPSARLGIEFNGLYWHSETFKSRTAHADKYTAAKAQGIRLIQIWEDDWRDKRPIVEAMLRHKLGASAQPKVAARSCEVENLEKAESDLFLSSHHIQGSVGATIRIGLQHPEHGLVAVMLLKKNGRSGRSWTLVRYATSAIVPGGFTRLLAHAERELPSGATLLTFADLEISDGGLYERHGFTVETVLAPDYKYVWKRSRTHKFNFRKRRFQVDPDLQFDPDLTERELATLNRIPRVYDSGKIRYSKIVT